MDPATDDLTFADDFLRSWRTAAEALREDDSASDVLVTREICVHILGWPLTDSRIEKTRRRIEEWLAGGVIEHASARRMNISGYMTTLSGFRLVGQEESHSAEG